MGWLSVTHFAHFLANTCMSHCSATWEGNRICRDTRAGKKLDPKPEESLASQSIVTQSIQGPLDHCNISWIAACSLFKSKLLPDHLKSQSIEVPPSQSLGATTSGETRACPIGIDRITGLDKPHHPSTAVLCELQSLT